MANDLPVTSTLKLSFTTENVQTFCSILDEMTYQYKLHNCVQKMITLAFVSGKQQ